MLNKLFNEYWFHRGVRRTFTLKSNYKKNWLSTTLHNHWIELLSLLRFQINFLTTVYFEIDTTLKPFAIVFKTSTILALNADSTRLTSDSYLVSNLESILAFFSKTIGTYVSAILWYLCWFYRIHEVFWLETWILEPQITNQIHEAAHDFVSHFYIRGICGLFLVGVKFCLWVF